MIAVPLSAVQKISLRDLPRVRSQMKAVLSSTLSPPVPKANHTCLQKYYLDSVSLPVSLSLSLNLSLSFSISSAD
jgi:hypothetical protein